jgi:twitching motility protein PilT
MRTLDIAVLRSTPSSLGFSREGTVALLREAARIGASEVLLKVPKEPLFRVGGSLNPARPEPLTPKDTLECVMSLASLAQVELAMTGCIDHEFSFGLDKVGRFRVAVFKQRGTVGASVHRIVCKPPDLEQLGLPAGAESALSTPGLTLVTGSRGRDAIHAMLARFNAHTSAHVVLLESPVLYLHRDELAAIAHREVGSDVKDFASGIRMAIRSHADALVLGEIPDEATAEAALLAAEHGLAVVAVIGAHGLEDAPRWWGRLYDNPLRRADAMGRYDKNVNLVLPVPAR